MSQTKRQFRSVFTAPQAEPAIDEMMEAVDNAATASNIGSIVRPSDIPPVPAESLSTTAESNVTPLAPRRARKVAPAPTQKGTVELPVYLWEEIALKHVKDKATKRYLVLQAFKDAGYTVHDIDLYKDGRRASE